MQVAKFGGESTKGSTMQKFELVKAQGADICPASGEDLGGFLAKVATEATDPYVREQVLYLAAEAFEAGASASIGHNRADRYEERARELRAEAEKVAAEDKAKRDDTESASLLAAFDDGFAGRDGKRHSFDAREAFLVGQLFAKERREMPSRINKVYAPRPLGRDSERDFLRVDDMRFVVDYPDGKVANAIVTQL
jgi:hypothetical protein